MLLDLHSLAQMVGLLARLGQRHEIRAADPDVPTLSILLDSKQPRCRTALSHFQEKTVTILIGATILRGGLDRYRRELAHLLTHIPASYSGKSSVGKPTSFPTPSPHRASDEGGSRWLCGDGLAAVYRRNPRVPMDIWRYR